jgi:hypothetical protein
MTHTKSPYVIRTPDGAEHEAAPSRRTTQMVLVKMQATYF